MSNGAVINIAAGATTGTVTVDARKDDVYKDAGKVDVSIDNATGGNFENLVPSTTPAVTDVSEIARATSRARVCQYVSISVVDVSSKNKDTMYLHITNDVTIEKLNKTRHQNTNQRLL